MLHQTYAAALWYLSYILPVRHTDNGSSETVLDNESSAITESFGNESKHARSSETAKDCSGTVSKNSVSGSVIAARSASDSVIAERSKDSARGSVIAQRSASDSVSAITASFGNESKHARSSETAKDCSETVSKNSVSGSVIAVRRASDSVIAERSKDSARGSVIAQRSAGHSVSAITASFGNESKHGVQKSS